MREYCTCVTGDRDEGDTEWRDCATHTEYDCYIMTCLICGTDYPDCED